MQIPNQLLIMIVPREIKDDVVDKLMAMEFISGFNLNLINGYSREHSEFDLSEQVEGYRKLYRFEILHIDVEREMILSALREKCQQANVRYWILPIKSQGHF